MGSTNREQDAAAAAAVASSQMQGIKNKSTLSSGLSITQQQANNSQTGGRYKKGVLGSGFSLGAEHEGSRKDMNNSIEVQLKSPLVISQVIPGSKMISSTKNNYNNSAWQQSAGADFNDYKPGGVLTSKMHRKKHKNMS